MKDILKVDWDAYSPIQRIICRIPILNLFFTEKFNVSFFVNAAHPCNSHDIWKKLRFPKSPKLGVYNILACMDKDFDPSQDVMMNDGVVHLVVTAYNKKGKVGSMKHPMRLGDQKELHKYYFRKDSYKSKLKLL